MGEHSLWSDSGVLLNGGHIEASGRSDIASRASGIVVRKADAMYRALGRIGDAIKSPRDSWNELTVRDPKIAGHYIAMGGIKEGESTNFRMRSGQRPAKELEEAQEMGLPLYAVNERNGEVHRAALKRENKMLVRLIVEAEPVSPQALASTSPFAIDETRRSELCEEVLTDAIFNMAKFQEKIPEVAYIQGARAGRRVLERFQHPPTDDYKNADDNGLSYFDYCEASKETGTYRLAISGEEIAIATMTADDLRRVTEEFYRAHRTYRGITVFSLEGARVLYTDSLDEGIKTVQEMPTFIEDQIGAIQARDQSDYSSMLIRSITGFCYGLANALDSSSSDQEYETADRLRGVAEQFLSEERFKEIRFRCVDEKGRFKIFLEEVAG